MSGRARALPAFFAMIVACVGCDHAAKRIAESTLADGAVSFAGGAVRFELASNPGAFLSLGAGLPEGVRHALLIGLVPLLLLFVIAQFLRAPRTPALLLLGLGLLAGGGLGNWLDRVLNDGAVTDFVSLGLGRLRTGVFNLADLAVIAGAAVLVRFTLRSEPQASEEHRG